MSNKIARVLVDQQIGGVSCKCGELVEGDASVLKAYIFQKKIDASKAAVEYAVDEGAEVRLIEVKLDESVDSVDPDNDSATDSGNIRNLTGASDGN